MESGQKVLSVVGTGPAGTAALTALDQEIKRTGNICSEVIVFAPDPSLGRSTPWATPVRHHVINMPLPTLGPWSSDPLGTAKAIRYDHLPPKKLNSMYIPRAKVGDAFEKMFEEGVESLMSHGVAVTIIRETAVDIGTDGEIVTLASSRGRVVKANAAILAVGNSEPDAFAHLRGTPGYIGPWDWAGTKRLVGEEFLVLGTSLSSRDRICDG